MYRKRETPDAVTLAGRDTLMADGLRDELRAIDMRIARMRELHKGSGDLLAQRLIKHALVERAELVAKQARRAGR
ncbi:MAG: hypothetical protein ABUL54_06105 [Dongia sp.]